MKNLAKILLVICFLVIDYGLFSQPYRTEFIEFYDYTTILNDLVKTGKKSKFYEQLNYEAMLFLDKSSLKVLKRVNPHFLDQNNIDTTNYFSVVPKNHVNVLHVSFTNIKQLFSTNDNWKSIILQLKRVNLDSKMDMMIDKEIYTKDNQKAIITIRQTSWSITYRVILRNKKLRFEELYEIQE